MNKITIYCEACLKVDGFRSMGEEFIRKLVINGKAKSTHQNYLRQIAFERMGIKPGICKCCGGKMVIVQTIPNRFAKRQRTPPSMVADGIPNFCHLR